MGLIQWLKGGEAESASEASAPAGGAVAASELLRRFIDKGEIGRGGMSSVRRVIDKNLMAGYQSVLDVKSDVQRFLAGGMHLATRTFAAGSRIVVEGDPGEAAYIITRGNCIAYKVIDGRRRVLREMGPGTVFGETAVISGEPRSATVEAVDEVVVAEVSRQVLEQGLGMDIWLGLFVRALADRFRDVDARLTAAERLIHDQQREREQERLRDQQRPRRGE